MQCRNRHFIANECESSLERGPVSENWIFYISYEYNVGRIEINENIILLIYSFNTKIYKIYKLHKISILCLNISHTSYAYRQTILLLYTLYIYPY